jgi:hypothetical protein
MAYGTVNADVIGTSVTGSNLGAGNASIMKNRLINSDMRVDQRNAGASVTAVDNGYTVDRWKTFSGVASSFSVQTQTSVIPVGFSNALKVTSLANSTVTTQAEAINQAIEGFNVADLNWGTANAKTVTLSFQVYSSLTGTFSGSLFNSAWNRSYPYTYTISSANTWTQISVTVAGDTTGTWLTTNGSGLVVNFDLGSGSNWKTTAGSWAGGAYSGATGSVSVVGTNGATFYITGVQLEVGSSATGFEYRQYGQELALCQRYYMNQPESLFFTGITSGRMGTNLAFPVQMRTTPTGALASTTLYWESLPYTTVGSLTSAVIDLTKCSSLGGALSIYGTFSPSPVTTYLSCLGGSQMTFSAEL